VLNKRGKNLSAQRLPLFLLLPTLFLCRLPSCVPGISR
jgi:hypothetical protein